MMKNKDIQALKKYFKTRSEVAFAYLFGSQARGKATKLSDVDIAVYFYPKKRWPVEYEEEIFYESEDEIWANLEKILNKEVELLVLNRASATVSASAIRGIPLIINDWGLYLDYMDTVTREAEDFMEMTINEFLFKQKIKNEKRISTKAIKTSGIS